MILLAYVFCRRHRGDAHVGKSHVPGDRIDQKPGR